MTVIIGLGTYGLDALHGGARRVRALRDLYRAAGIRYVHVAAVQARHVSAVAGEDEFMLGLARRGFPYEWLFADLISGTQAACDPVAYDTVRDLVLRLRPRAIQLEQPFMFPLFHRLRIEGHLRGTKLIFSTQNDEGRLRRDLVEAFHLAQPAAMKYANWVGELDRKCLAEADLVLAVSEQEATAFRAVARAPVILAQNGATPRSAKAERIEFWRRRMPSPFAVLVGSGHAPNIHGFVELLVDGGMPYIPPQPSMVVCGGMANHMLDDPRIQAHKSAFASRALLVPEVADDELAAVLAASAFVAVPITYGSGTNLKTAEALAAMKPVLSTPHGARGFERFRGTTGFVIASGVQDFRRSFASLLRGPELILTAEDRARRETVYWQYALKGVLSAVLGLLADSEFAPEGAIRAAERPEGANPTA